MPLEGNPEVTHFSYPLSLRISFQVLNKFLKSLGVKNNDYAFVEIIGFDDELLAFIPNQFVLYLSYFLLLNKEN
jgi:hypothetical protein